MFRANVLHVASEYDVCGARQEALSAAGFQVYSTVDVGEAYDCMAPGRFDLLVMDDNIPQVYRDVLIRHAKQQCHTRVLMVCEPGSPFDPRVDACVFGASGSAALVNVVEELTVRVHAPLST